MEDTADYSFSDFRSPFPVLVTCIYNPSKCKEIIFRKEGFVQDIGQVNNIPRQCTELSILGVTFQQENCKYSEHVRAKLIKANKCLFVLGFSDLAEVLRKWN